MGGSQSGTHAAAGEREQPERAEDAPLHGESIEVQLCDIDGKEGVSSVNTNGHCEDAKTEDGEERFQTIDITDQEGSGDAEQNITLEVNSMEAKQNDINDGFRRFFSSIGFRLTVKSGSADRPKIQTEQPSAPDDPERPPTETSEEKLGEEEKSSDPTACSTPTDETSVDLKDHDDQTSQGQAAAGEEPHVHEEQRPTSPSSLHQEVQGSPMKKFFTTGIFSGLRKKKKPEDMDATGEGGRERGTSEVAGEDQPEQSGPGEEAAARDEERVETREEAMEPETVSSRERAQASPLKRLFTSPSLRRFAKKPEKIPNESGEHASDEQASEERLKDEDSKETKVEESGAWASFKKLMTPKKTPKKPDEEPQAERPAKLSDGDKLSDSSLEQSRKRKDSSVSWEAVLCGSGRRRSNRGSQEELPGAAPGGESEGVAGALKQTEPSPDGEAGFTWNSFKRLITPKRRAREDEEAGSKSRNEPPAPAESDLMPAGQPRDEAAESDEDSDTPAVVPWSEFLDDPIPAEEKTRIPVDQSPAQRSDSPGLDGADPKEEAAASEMKAVILDEVTEAISKHPQLSDIPEESAVPETVAPPVEEEPAGDDTLAEDLTDITSEAMTAPEPADFTLTDETEMMSAVSQLSESAESGASTPVPAYYSLEETEQVLARAVETMSAATEVTPFSSEEVNVKRIVGSVTNQTLAAAFEDEPALLEIHRKSDASSIQTGLNAEELAEEENMEATVELESLSGISQALNSEMTSEIAPEDLDQAVAADEVLLLRLEVQHAKEEDPELTPEVSGVEDASQEADEGEDHEVTAVGVLQVERSDLQETVVASAAEPSADTEEALLPLTEVTVAHDEDQSVVVSGDGPHADPIRGEEQETPAEESSVSVEEHRVQIVEKERPLDDPPGGLETYAESENEPVEDLAGHMTTEAEAETGKQDHLQGLPDDDHEANQAKSEEAGGPPSASKEMGATPQEDILEEEPVLDDQVLIEESSGEPGEFPTEATSEEPEAEQADVSGDNMNRETQEVEEEVLSGDSEPEAEKDQDVCNNRAEDLEAGGEESTEQVKDSAEHPPPSTPTSPPEEPEAPQAEPVLNLEGPPCVEEVSAEDILASTSEDSVDLEAPPSEKQDDLSEEDVPPSILINPEEPEAPQAERAVDLEGAPCVEEVSTEDVLANTSEDSVNLEARPSKKQDDLSEEDVPLSILISPEEPEAPQAEPAVDLGVAPCVEEVATEETTPGPSEEAEMDSVSDGRSLREEEHADLEESPDMMAVDSVEERTAESEERSDCNSGQQEETREPGTEPGDPVGLRSQAVVSEVIPEAGLVPGSEEAQPAEGAADGTPQPPGGETGGSGSSSEPTVEKCFFSGRDVIQDLGLEGVHPEPVLEDASLTAMECSSSQVHEENVSHTEQEASLAEEEHSLGVLQRVVDEAAEEELVVDRGAPPESEAADEGPAQITESGVGEPRTEEPEESSAHIQPENEAAAAGPAAISSGLDPPQSVEEEEEHGEEPAADTPELTEAMEAAEKVELELYHSKVTGTSQPEESGATGGDSEEDTDQGDEDVETTLDTEQSNAESDERVAETVSSVGGQENREAGVEKARETSAGLEQREVGGEGEQDSSMQEPTEELSHVEQVDRASEDPEETDVSAEDPEALTCSGENVEAQQPDPPSEEDLSAPEVLREEEAVRGPENECPEQCFAQITETFVREVPQKPRDQEVETPKGQKPAVHQDILTSTSEDSGDLEARPAEKQDDLSEEDVPLSILISPEEPEAPQAEPAVDPEGLPCVEEVATEETAPGPSEEAEMDSVSDGRLLSEEEHADLGESPDMMAVDSVEERAAASEDQHEVLRRKTTMDAEQSDVEIAERTPGGADETDVPEEATEEAGVEEREAQEELESLICCRMEDTQQPEEDLSAPEVLREEEAARGPENESPAGPEQCFAQITETIVREAPQKPRDQEVETPTGQEPAVHQDILASTSEDSVDLEARPAEKQDDLSEEDVPLSILISPEEPEAPQAEPAVDPEGLPCVEEVATEETAPGPSEEAEMDSVSDGRLLSEEEHADLEESPDMMAVDSVEVRAAASEDQHEVLRRKTTMDAEQSDVEIAERTPGGADETDVPEEATEEAGVEEREAQEELESLICCRMEDTQQPEEDLSAPEVLREEEAARGPDHQSPAGPEQCFAQITETIVREAPQKPRDQEVETPEGQEPAAHQDILEDTNAQPSENQDDLTKEDVPPSILISPEEPEAPQAEPAVDLEDAPCDEEVPTDRAGEETAGSGSSSEPTVEKCFFSGRDVIQDLGLEGVHPDPALEDASLTAMECSSSQVQEENVSHAEQEASLAEEEHSLGVLQRVVDEAAEEELVVDHGALPESQATAEGPAQITESGVGEPRTEEPEENSAHIQPQNEAAAAGPAAISSGLDPPQSVEEEEERGEERGEEAVDKTQEPAEEVEEASSTGGIQMDQTPGTEVVRKQEERSGEETLASLRVEGSGESVQGVEKAVEDAPQEEVLREETEIDDTRTCVVESERRSEAGTCGSVSEVAPDGPHEEQPPGSPAAGEGHVLTTQSVEEQEGQDRVLRRAAACGDQIQHPEPSEDSDVCSKERSVGEETGQARRPPAGDAAEEQGLTTGTKSDEAAEETDLDQSRVHRVGVESEAVLVRPDPGRVSPVEPEEHQASTDLCVEGGPATEMASVLLEPEPIDDSACRQAEESEAVEVQGRPQHHQSPSTEPAELLVAAPEPQMDVEVSPVEDTQGRLGSEEMVAGCSQRHHASLIAAELETQLGWREEPRHIMSAAEAHSSAEESSLAPKTLTHGADVTEDLKAAALPCEEQKEASPEVEAHEAGPDVPPPQSWTGRALVLEETMVTSTHVTVQEIRVVTPPPVEAEEQREKMARIMESTHLQASFEEENEDVVQHVEEQRETPSGALMDQEEDDGTARHEEEDGKVQRDALQLSSAPDQAGETSEADEEAPVFEDLAKDVSMEGPRAETTPESGTVSTAVRVHSQSPPVDEEGSEVSVREGDTRDVLASSLSEAPADECQMEKMEEPEAPTEAAAIFGTLVGLQAIQATEGDLPRATGRRRAPEQQTSAKDEEDVWLDAEESILTEEDASHVEDFVDADEEAREERGEAPARGSESDTLETGSETEEFTAALEDPDVPSTSVTTAD